MLLTVRLITVKTTTKIREWYIKATTWRIMSVKTSSVSSTMPSHSWWRLGKRVAKSMSIVCRAFQDHQLSALRTWSLQKGSTSMRDTREWKRGDSVRIQTWLSSLSLIGSISVCMTRTSTVFLSTHVCSTWCLIKLKIHIESSESYFSRICITTSQLVRSSTHEAWS